ncbi:DUF4079 domain-containing protein [Oscillatoriales cyanobacterium LEGE 11467]|uniref:DUF4079 domain-containing protein n=1 Tax=Zarconia navalis LEGE 11467 TaxID=1828826 RepID=A0A928VV86_9CYAN|nr:DUF4079 domain-containing protein [Zarconia navalis]MBE9040776.1 DUF4079 domain-containing protein [Zarconia navalis LEGE 11467]
MNFSELLEPIASQFRDLGMPEPIVHWGHPLMMGIVIFAMGSAVGLTGWRGRMATETAVSGENFSTHRKIAPLMFLFLGLGYTGGLLSLVMQHEAVLKSPHFWTGSVVIILLSIQSVLSLSSFWGERSSLRTVHAYLGGTTLWVMFLHAMLGLKLGLSI